MATQKAATMLAAARKTVHVSARGTLAEPSADSERLRCQGPSSPCYLALILDAIACRDLSNSATRASRSAFTCWNAVSPALFNSASF